ncbi:MAG: PqqD family protein [Oscillospiraceae bacterium]|nr:PqqD family protein [Ruminococcus sp.]MBQ9982428.1 PqqD family protein [Oscillospiraceae bacterium]
MKLKEGFITHESMSEHITVTAGNTDFNGMVRSNQTAGFIIECLKNDVTCDEIVAKMLEKYDAPEDVIRKDVDRILKQLGDIGAIDD